MAYLETLLSYGADAAISHLINSYWYKDVGDDALRPYESRVDKHWMHRSLEQTGTKQRN